MVEYIVHKFPGFSVMLFIDQSQYIGALAQSAGIRLLVHRQDHHPFLEDEGIDVGTGELTSIRLRLVGLSLPYNQHN